MRTAECRIPFRIQTSLPPSPFMLSATLLVAGPPTNTIAAVFDVPMDTSVLPNPANFTADRDGVPVVLMNPFWLNATTLFLDYAGIAPIVSGDLLFHTQDINLRSAMGTLADPPQLITYFP